jgi:hypothetical protein
LAKNFSDGEVAVRYPNSRSSIGLEPDDSAKGSHKREEGMTRLPHSREVSRALRTLKAAADKVIRELNRIAGQKIARGDYSAAEELAARGKGLTQFQADIRVLQEKWRATSLPSTSRVKGNITPLWRYYQPILQALIQRGGEGKAKDVESGVGKLMATALLAGDKVSMAQGRERWKVMVRRARKPLISEGWIEDADGAVWRVTEAGKRVADNGVERQTHSPS